MSGLKFSKTLNSYIPQNLNFILFYNFLCFMLIPLLHFNATFPS